MTLEVTTFRPSLVERRLHIPGGTSDDPCDGKPRRLIGRKASLDVHVENDDDAEVMMTEDNIILMTVRCLADDSFPVLIMISRRTAGSRISHGRRNHNIDVLTTPLCVAWTLHTKGWFA